MRHYKGVTIYHHDQRYFILPLPKDLITGLDDSQKIKFRILMSEGCMNNGIKGIPIAIWIDEQNKIKTMDDMGSSHSFLIEMYNISEWEYLANQSNEYITINLENI